jgi:sugar lactone lactonase YvrE
MINKHFFTVIAIFSFICFSAFSEAPGGKSYYIHKPEDPDAIYFTSENYKITSDGKSDISEALQGAIDKLKLENNFGIIFIPEGEYRISKTIYIPGAIRLIGYGKKRPLIVLSANTSGYQEPVPSDKGKANYMFWFTSTVVEPGKKVNDAGAGTFYSAMSNIDLKIDDGNPQAVALRTHFAQHSFVSHCDIYAGKGKAGLFDIGNEMEDVRFFGGDYGIYTTKASPGWQFMMLDTYFEGQRIAAIKTQQAGLTIVRMRVKNVPEVVKVDTNYWEKLFMEDCRFENVTGPAISFDDEGNASMQINLRNVACRNVPEIVKYLKSDTSSMGPSPAYIIRKYVYGLQMDDMDAVPEIKMTLIAENFRRLPPATESDIPSLPEMSTWVNIKELGAKGDGETDDTKAIMDAIDRYSTIYFPQGLYRITETVRLKPNTALIGLHPIATQIMLGESTGSFSGFGTPKPMIEAPEGGTNIISGIGISSGEYNFRAVACKWMAGTRSLMEDVKFVGGHGSMKKGPYVPWGGYGNRTVKPLPIPGPDPAWDTQYWSLWVTNNGGGVFKNIWTASTYAVSGIYVSNTSLASRIYAMSVEHHVRNEVRFSNVSNWKIYALQLEEESREGSECQPMEIVNCGNLTFANLYMFRVIRVKIPYPYSVRTWNSKNIELLNVHNYSQIKYTTVNPLYDITTNTEVRPVEFARLFISGDAPANFPATTGDRVNLIAKGFEFAEGICNDSKGNIYFCEQRMKRIYKWSSTTGILSLLADYPWQPLSLACDSRDNLLVVFRYDPQPGLMIDGKQQQFSNPPDASGTSFSMWGNSGFTTLAFSVNPDDPDETIGLMKKVPMGSAGHILKALYPSNRWRDYHDFNKISVNRNEECFMAPDEKTIIPVCYDLARSCSLVEAYSGKKVYACDEYDKRTVSMDVDQDGYLSDLKYFAEKGEFSVTEDSSGNVYIADGEIYIFDKNGIQKDMIRVPERPSGLAFGGKDGRTLFITGRSALYALELK